MELHTDPQGPEKVKGTGKKTYSCTSKTCGSEYSDKQCFCYARDDASNVMTEQFCAFESDGFLMACDPGCCKNQCPRPECKSIKPTAPEKEPPTGSTGTTGTSDSTGSTASTGSTGSTGVTIPVYAKILVIILVMLILLSILFYVW